MKIRDGFKIAELSGQHTVVAEGEQAKSFTDTIVLNDTALFLFQLLKARDVTKREMLDAVLEKFDISTILALRDIDIFLRTMKEKGIIE